MNGMCDMCNVMEWSDSCDAAGCKIRGGGYTETLDPSCNFLGFSPREEVFSQIGFRCCAN